MGSAWGGSYGINSIWEKGGGGAHYVGAATCLMHAHVCACVTGGASVLAVAGVYPCPACSLSSSVDYREEYCVRKTLHCV